MIDWQYSESIESPDIVSIKKKYTNYIGGKFVEPKSKLSCNKKHKKRFKIRSTKYDRYNV